MTDMKKMLENCVDGDIYDKVASLIDMKYDKSQFSSILESMSFSQVFKLHEAVSNKDETLIESILETNTYAKAETVYSSRAGIQAPVKNEKPGDEKEDEEQSKAIQHNMAEIEKLKDLAGIKNETTTAGGIATVATPLKSEDDEDKLIKR